jgi:DNA-binding CsgD family transcriptional regulator
MAQSVAGPNDDVARQLAATGAAAYRRGALAAAADAYEQAARLSQSGAARSRHLLSAAGVRWAAGDFRQASSLLRDVIDRTDDPDVRARMAVILGQTEVWSTGAHRVACQLEDQARAVAEVAPGLGAVLLLHAGVSRLMALDVDGAVDASEAALALANRSDDTAAFFGAHAIVALCRFFAGGGPASEAAIAPIAQVAVAGLDASDDEGATPIALLCAYAQVTQGAVDAAIEVVDRVIGTDGARALVRTVMAQMVREPGIVWWQADAIEAYHGCGRTEEAAEALTRLEAMATATQRPWAIAAAARSSVLVHPEVDAEAAFATALDGFRALRAPFEEARTLLARAEHGLRAGRSREGRRDAAAARTIFDQHGARAWSDQAGRLRGGTAGASTTLATRLTQAELRVALAVGQGASSREAAAALYISAKTVNYHVQNIYRKLGLNRRAQLAALVATDPTALGVPASAPAPPLRTDAYTARPPGRMRRPQRRSAQSIWSTRWNEITTRLTRISGMPIHPGSGTIVRTQSGAPSGSQRSSRVMARPGSPMPPTVSTVVSGAHTNRVSSRALNPAQMKGPTRPKPTPSRSMTHSTASSSVVMRPKYAGPWWPARRGRSARE